MPRRSTLARLLATLTAGVLALAAAWCAWWWARSPLIAAAGALLIAFSYAVVLAAECVFLRVVSRHDSAPRPSARELLRAWWAETCEVPRVFCWRQPLRWREVADDLGPHTRGRRGIVLVHGFICNRGFWTPWLARLRGSGHAFMAVNLEPVFGSIDQYAPIVDEAVRAVTAASGMPPVLVCHSMGGLAARAWLRASGDAARVHRVVTIGSPHQGTWLARFSQFPNGQQMRLDSEWLKELARAEAGRELPPFTCWYSHCDHIVFPVTHATLPGADNRLVCGPAHVELAFVPEVLEGSLALLAATTAEPLPAGVTY